MSRLTKALAYLGSDKVTNFVLEVVMILALAALLINGDIWQDFWPD